MTRVWVFLIAVLVSTTIGILADGALVLALVGALALDRLLADAHLPSFGWSDGVDHRARDRPPVPPESGAT